MIHARLDPASGYLYEITHREPTYLDDVPLDAMPPGFGPWTYDAVNRLAIELTPAEKKTLDDAAHPERTDLRQSAQTAIAALDAYLAIADTATAGQVRDQVKRLSQMVRRLIIRVVQID